MPGSFHACLDAPSAGKFPVVDRPRRFFQTMPRFVRHDRAAGKGRRARSKVERGFRTLKGPELREITSHTIATPAALPSPPLADQIANPLYTPTASATSTARPTSPPGKGKPTVPAAEARLPDRGRRENSMVSPRFQIRFPEASFGRYWSISTSASASTSASISAWSSCTATRSGS